jgi:hypothetical protein
MDYLKTNAKNTKYNKRRKNRRTSPSPSVEYTHSSPSTTPLPLGIFVD